MTPAAAAVRAALAGSTGRRVVLPREHVEALLATSPSTAGEPAAAAVTLTAADAERLAAAAWAVSAVRRGADMLGGDWPPLDSRDHADVLAAARRTLAYLITGEVPR